MKAEVILVDEKDNPIGTMEKQEVHQKGLLHRAFSIFIFNGGNEILLQQRALHKYHSGGLWSNTCCSHPKPGEEILSAAKSRLKEEMGIDCELKEVFTFVYKERVGDNLIEHELDHVFIGKFDGDPKCDPSEVMSWKFSSIENIQVELKTNPQSFTVWFKPAFEKLLSVEQIQSNQNDHEKNYE